MNACRDFDLLLSLRAAGALGPVEAARVEAHLAVCPACRAEAAARAEALFLAKLPSISAAEQSTFRDLPERTLRALRHADRSRGLGKRIVAGMAIAAAAAAVVLAPAILRKATPGVAPQEAVSPVVSRPVRAGWEAPDPDMLWEEAALFEDDSSTATSGGDASDAVLAALDY